MENKQELSSIAQSVIFKAKASLFRIKRRTENFFDSGLKKHPKRNLLIKKSIVGESKTELWTDKTPAEKFLTAGKIHNLRLAIKKLDGLEIPANAVFSFWKQVGKANRFNHYVIGRELREGCIIPNVGGGLCQISNALIETVETGNAGELKLKLQNILAQL